MIYKNVYNKSGHIKYGCSNDFDKRIKAYKTCLGDLIESTIKFPDEKDRVDELAIKEYLVRYLHLSPVPGCKEIFEYSGDLSLIDNDVTLETFYRHLDSLGYLSPGSGKVAGYLRKRMIALHRLFLYKEDFAVNKDIIKIMASLMESLYLNNSTSLGDNIFIKAKVDEPSMNYLLSLKLTCRDLLDCWFKWDWSKVIETE
jgi:hypothetical protein